jgi:hypothetical protein
MFINEKFPLCRQCGNSVVFRFLRRASEPVTSALIKIFAARLQVAEKAGLSADRLKQRRHAA